MTKERNPDRSTWSARDLIEATIADARASKEKAAIEAATAFAQDVQAEEARKAEAVRMTWSPTAAELAEIRDYMSAVRKKTGPRPVMTEAVRNFYKNIGRAGGVRAGETMTEAERQARTAKGNRVRWGKTPDRK